MTTQTDARSSQIDRECRHFESFHVPVYWALATLALVGTPSHGEMVHCATDVRPFEEARRLAGSGGLTHFSCAGPDECALLEVLQQWRDENLPTRTGASRVIYAPVCDEFECVACVGYQGNPDERGKCAVVGCLELRSSSLILKDEIYVDWSCVDGVDRSAIKRRTLERVDDLLVPPPDGTEIIEHARSLSGNVVVLVDRTGSVVDVPFGAGFAIFDLDSPPFERWVSSTFEAGLHFRAQPGSAPSVIGLKLELRSLDKGVDAAIVERTGCWERRWRAQLPGHPWWEPNEWTRVAGCKPKAATKQP